MARIGKLLRERRHELNMTRAEMSRLSTFSPQYLLEIEQEKRVPTKPNTLDILAATLNLSRDIVYYAVGRLPPDIASVELEDREICHGFNCFRRIIDQKSEQQEAG